MMWLFKGPAMAGRLVVRNLKWPAAGRSSKTVAGGSSSFNGEGEPKTVRSIEEKRQILGRVKRPN
jgi:hypothetical protein